MIAKATSPTASGPSGAEFEAKVAAFYNLAMLAQAEPRGLPETEIVRVALQRSAEGYPLDDVIIHARTRQGMQATLEIQVKRTINFTLSNEAFRKTVKQIIDASKKPEFKTEQYELAIATAQTSQKIEGSYQDVLRWAREVGDSATFFERIARSGSANDHMRTFVETFRSQVVSAGGTNDDETIWALLRRLQILVFDFNATGSVCEQLIIDRATKVLHREEGDQARALWSVLIQISLQSATNGGDRNRTTLMEEPVLQSFRFSGYQSYGFACDVLAEASDNALKDINDQIENITLTRYERLSAIREALEKGRYLEIRGEPGTGKSGLLKQYAKQIIKEGRAIVLSPSRAMIGGWAAMRMSLRFEGTAQDLLRELALDGGATIFVDNLDLYNEGQRAVVNDLIRAASCIPGISVIATARNNFGLEEPSWLPYDELAVLGKAPPIQINDLNETEIEEIKQSLPALTPLLMEGHPAYEVSRTLFRLAYLARQPKEAQCVFSETQMASVWWNTVDNLPSNQRRSALRILTAVVQQSLKGSEPTDISAYPADIVDLLVRKGILRDLGNEQVVFCHDVFCEWGIANFLQSSSLKTDLLMLEKPARSNVSRGIELAARMPLEISTDFPKWKLIWDLVTHENVHHTWRRAVLIGLVRSEIANKLLSDPSVSAFLLAEGAGALRELIGILMATDAFPASELFVNQGIPQEKIPPGLYVPIGPSWGRMIIWLLTIEKLLPEEAIPCVINFYTSWCNGRLGKGISIPVVLRSLYRWLRQIEIARRFEHSDNCPKPFGCALDFHRRKEIESDLRSVFLVFCDRVPELALEYLQTLSKRRKSDDAVRDVLTYSEILARVVPKELAEFTEKILIEEQDLDGNGADPTRGPFVHSFECIWSPPSPARGPFFELLKVAPKHGLFLIHQLTECAVSFLKNRCQETDTVVIDFEGKSRIFPLKASYEWSRGTGFVVVASALMALESWAHQRIENGEDFNVVLADVMGPVGSPAAYLLVAVDLLISHWPKSSKAAIPFVACLVLLNLDKQRSIHDRVFPDFSRTLPTKVESQGTINLAGLKNRPSRGFSLLDLIGQYAISESDSLREALQDHLQGSSGRFEQSGDRSVMEDLGAVASCALNRINPLNWMLITDSDDLSKKGYQYIPPIDEHSHFEMLRKDIEKISKTCQPNEDCQDNGIKAVLEAAINDHMPVSQTFSLISSLGGDHLYRALLRCAFAGCILSKRDIILSENEFTIRRERHQEWLRLVLGDELAWCAGEQDEPQWPLFPLEEDRDKCVDYQRAALLLRTCREFLDVTQHQWLLDFLRIYAVYATTEDNTRYCHWVWNIEYFGLLARCAPYLTLEEFKQLALTRICGFSDEVFFKVIPLFLENIDQLYFDQNSLEESVIVEIRSTLADRLMESNSWKYLGIKPSHAIDVLLQPAVDAIFFNKRMLSEPPMCYLGKEVIDRIGSFLLILEKLIQSCPSAFVAVLVLNLIEMTLREEYVAFVLKSARIWMEKFHSDTSFWIDYGIGHKLCMWFETIMLQSSLFHTDKSLQRDMDQLLGKLIKVGIPEASRLEKMLYPSS